MSVAVSAEAPRREERRRALLLAYASIALAATVAAAAIALDGATSDAVLVATARALIVGVPLGVGLYAWYAREETRFGVLLFLELNLTDAMDASVSRRVKAPLLYLAERGDG